MNIFLQSISSYYQCGLNKIAEATLPSPTHFQFGVPESIPVKDYDLKTLTEEIWNVHGTTISKVLSVGTVILGVGILAILNARAFKRNQTPLAPQQPIINTEKVIGEESLEGWLSRKERYKFYARKVDCLRFVSFLRNQEGASPIELLKATWMLFNVMKEFFTQEYSVAHKEKFRSLLMEEKEQNLTIRELLTQLSEQSKDLRVVANYKVVLRIMELFEADLKEVYQNKNMLDELNQIEKIMKCYSMGPNNVCYTSSDKVLNLRNEIFKLNLKELAPYFKEPLPFDALLTTLFQIPMEEMWLYLFDQKYSIDIHEAIEAIYVKCNRVNDYPLEYVKKKEKKTLEKLWGEETVETVQINEPKQTIKTFKCLRKILKIATQTNNDLNPQNWRWIYNNFGPLESFLENCESFWKKNHQCFHGWVETNDLNKLLSQDPGAFLLRYSDSEPTFSFSYQKSDGTIGNIRLKNYADQGHPGKYSLQEDNEPESLDIVIEKCIKKRENNTEAKPIKNDQFDAWYAEITKS